jgi:UDP-glucose 4-epimerase
MDREGGTRGARLFILRPPLVYGPGVKANFRSLLHAAVLGNRGLPLPLGSASAPRSYVSVSNLCDVVVSIIVRRPGTGGVFHVTDERDWSVRELMGLWGVPDNRLWRVPARLMVGLGRVMGGGRSMASLFTPCRIDQRQTLEVLKWRPVGTSDAHLKETLSWYRANP